MKFKNLLFSNLKKKLLPPHKKFYAEFETDRIIRESFYGDFSYQGIMVEVGGATPEFISMSKHFKDCGWRCIIIEPNPEFCRLHRKAGNEVVECACSFEDKEASEFQVVNWHKTSEIKADGISEHSFSSLQVKKEYLQKHNYQSVEELHYRTIQVRVRRLDAILQELQVPRLDIVSVDTEGWELEVLQGLDLAKYRPKVVVLENYLDNHKYPEYMEMAGYSIACQCGHNTVFVHPYH